MGVESICHIEKVEYSDSLIAANRVVATLATPLAGRGTQVGRDTLNADQLPGSAGAGAAVVPC
jgi:hypothetical protein